MNLSHFRWGRWPVSYATRGHVFIGIYSRTVRFVILGAKKRRPRRPQPATIFVEIVRLHRLMATRTASSALLANVDCAGTCLV